MTQRTKRVLGALLATWALIAVAAPMAHADRASRPDPAGDVWLNDGEGENDHYSQAGSVVNTDVRRTSVRHLKRYVTIRTEFVSLRKKVSEQIEHFLYLRTDGSGQFAVIVNVDTWNGQTGYYVHGYDDQGPRECDDVTGSTRFDKETIQVRVPRSCLGSPRWIRFQGRTVSYVEDVGTYSDSAMGPGREPRVWSRRLHRG